MSTTTDQRSILIRAREALGLDVLEDLAEQISTEALERSAAVVNERALINAAADAVLTGGEIPADLGADLAAARVAAAQNGAALEILRATQERLPDAFREHCQARADQALAVVRAEIDEIVSAARTAFVTLGPVRTADDAIEGGVSDEWLTARRLAVRYAEARAAQATIISAAVDTTRDNTTPGDGITARGALLTDYFGTIDSPWLYDPGLVQTFDNQLARIRTGHTPERADYFGRAIPAGVHRLPWQIDTADQLHALRWLTTTENVEVCTPTLGELITAERQGREQAEGNGYTRHPNQGREPWQRDDTRPGRSMIVETIG
jgi:hypothetical protein